jgi:hypothetical protein
MKNQALKFILIQAKDKRCYKSYQQEYQDDNAENGIHV